MASRIKKITLRRTPCHGECPVYEVTVRGTGEVEYFGEAHVHKAGTHRWRISDRRLQRLAEAFKRARYSRLEDRYTNREFAGAPSCLTSIEYEDGSFKSVDHYHGDPTAPDALTELEDEIDRILGVERYTEPDLRYEPNSGRPTYLLTFNPEKAYKWEDLRDCIDDVRDHGFYATSWSCGRNRRITAGDRVFMMRQGHASGERRGIFASGWATSEVYQQEHWDEAEARKGKLALYLPIRLDVLLDPDSEPIIPRSLLKEDSLLAGGPWDARTGGVKIPDEIAAELEKAWSRLLASQGIVQLHAWRCRQ